jgi:hypothetical protein
MRGRIEDVAWRLPDDLSEDEWIDSGIVLARVGAGVMWWVGDWWIYGENHYGDRKAIVQDPNWRGPCFQTCANAASVCRAFRTSRRREAGHGIWQRDFSGAGGLFGIVFKPVAQGAVNAFLDELSLFGIGASWGGFESV